MAKRDGWRVSEDKAGSFTIENGRDACYVYASKYGVTVYAEGSTMPPARAMQFARKVQDIAARQENRQAKGAGHE